VRISKSSDGIARVWLGVILLLALGLRLGWGASRPASDVYLAALPDQVEYLSIARNLLIGRGLSFIDPRFQERVYAFRTPGYPMFVAACGGNVRAVRLAQGVLDTGTALAVFVLAILLMPGARKKGAVGAAGLVAFNPFLIYFSGLLLSETLFTAMLAWGMVLLISGNAGPDRPPRAFIWLAGGILLALAVLVRPSAAPLPIILAIAAAFANHTRGVAYQPPWPLPVASTLLVVVLLVLTPWALRNYRIFHELIWTDTNAGFTLYDGYNPDATGASDQRFIRYLPQLRLMGEAQRSEYLTLRARSYIQRHPRRVLDLAAAKAGRTWSPVPLSEQFGKLMYRWIAGLYSVPFDLLVLWAIWRGNLRKPAKTFLLTPAIYLTVVHALTIGSLRYRLPAEPPMAVLAACILNRKEPRWKRAKRAAMTSLDDE